MDTEILAWAGAFLPCFHVSHVHVPADGALFHNTDRRPRPAIAGTALPSLSTMWWARQSCSDAISKGDKSADRGFAVPLRAALTGGLSLLKVEFADFFHIFLTLILQKKRH